MALTDFPGIDCHWAVNKQLASRFLPVIVDRACGASHFVRKYRRARDSGNVNFSVGHCHVCTDWAVLLQLRSRDLTTRALTAWMTFLLALSVEWIARCYWKYWGQASRYKRWIFLENGVCRIIYSKQHVIARIKFAWKMRLINMILLIIQLSIILILPLCFLFSFSFINIIYIYIPQLIKLYIQ